MVDEGEFWVWGFRDCYLLLVLKTMQFPWKKTLVCNFIRAIITGPFAFWALNVTKTSTSSIIWALFRFLFFFHSQANLSYESVLRWDDFEVRVYKLKIFIIGLFNLNMRYVSQWDRLIQKFMFTKTCMRPPHACNRKNFVLVEFKP